MSAGTPLAQQSVEFTAKGIEAVKSAMDGIRTGLGKVEQATQQVAAQVAATPAAIGAAVAGFQMLTSAARGWVQAGLAGTAQGGAMQAQFALLSQQIAGVFVPTIQAVTRIIKDLADWFRSLSGDQQTVIRYFVEAAAVMVVASQVLGRVKGAIVSFVLSAVSGMVAVAGSIISTLIPAFGSLVMSVVTGSFTMKAALDFASAGITVILGLIAAAASALVSLGMAGAIAGAGLAVGTESGRTGLRQLWDAIKPLIDTLKDFGASLMATLGPALNQLGGLAAGMFGRMATAIGGLLQRALPTIQAIVEWTVQAVGWLFRAADAVISWIASFVTVRGVVATVVGVLVATAAVIAGVLTPVIANIVIVMAPFVPLVLAIGAAFAAVGVVLVGIGYVLVRVTQALMPLFSVVWDILKAFIDLGIAIGTIVYQASGLGQMFSDAFGAGGNMVDTFFEKIQALATWLQVNLPQAVTYFVNALGRGLEAMIPIFVRIGNVIAAALWGWDQLTNGESAQRFANMIQTSVNALSQVAGTLQNFHVNVGGGAGSAAAGTPARNRPRTDVSPAGGQFEEAAALFKRLSETSIRSAADAARERREEQIAANTAQIAQNTNPANANGPNVVLGAGGGGGGAAGGIQ